MRISSIIIISWIVFLVKFKWLLLLVIISAIVISLIRTVCLSRIPVIVLIIVILIRLNGIMTLIIVAYVLSTTLSKTLMFNSIWWVVLTSFIWVIHFSIVALVVLFLLTVFNVIVASMIVPLLKSPRKHILIHIFKVFMLLSKKLCLYIKLRLLILPFGLFILRRIRIRKLRMQVGYDSLLHVNRRSSILILL